jgi:hypothetical protein
VLPDALQEGFTAAMSQSLLLPACVAVVGALVVVFFAKPKPPSWGPRADAAAAAELSAKLDGGPSGAASR